MMPYRSSTRFSRAPATAQRRFKQAMTSRSSWRALMAGIALSGGVMGPAAAISELDLAGSPPAGNITLNPETDADNLVLDQADEKGIINWTTLNIAQGESLRFNQPSATSITLNRVVGEEGGIDPSVIAGALSANGNIWVLNPAGIVISATGSVDAAGFLATPSRITDGEFLDPGGEGSLSAGYDFETEEGDGGASVVNAGTITVNTDETVPGGTKTANGYVVLSAPYVENSGVIQGRLSNVVLGGANAFAVTFEGNELVAYDITEAVLAKLEGMDALVEVTADGEIRTAGGKILLSTSAFDTVVDNVINMDGIAEATTVGVDGFAVGGTIELGAGINDDLAGTDQIISVGGTIAADYYADVAGPNIVISGSVNAGQLTSVFAGDDAVIAEGAEVAATGETGLVQVFGATVDNAGLIEGADAEVIAQDSIANAATGVIRGTGPDASLYLSAGTVDNAGTVELTNADVPGDVTIFADAFLNTGTISAPGGTVYLNPQLSGTTVDLISAELESFFVGSGTLVIRDTDVQGISTDTLVIGGAVGEDLFRFAGDIAVYGNFASQGAGGAGGPVNLVLASSGSVYQAESGEGGLIGSLTVPRLTVLADLDVFLAETANTVDTLMGEAGGFFEFSNGVDLTIEALPGIGGAGTTFTEMSADFVLLDAAAFTINAPIVANSIVALDAPGTIEVNARVAANAILIGFDIAPTAISISETGSLETTPWTDQDPEDEFPDPPYIKPLIYLRADEETGTIAVDPLARIRVIDGSLLSALAGGDITIYSRGIPPIVGEVQSFGTFHIAANSANGNLLITHDGEPGDREFDLVICDGATSLGLTELAFPLASGLSAAGTIALRNETSLGYVYADTSITAGGDILIALAAADEPGFEGQFLQSLLFGNETVSISSETGDVTIIADVMELGYISAAGAVNLQNATAGRDIYLIDEVPEDEGQVSAFAVVPGGVLVDGLYISQAETERIVATILRIGRVDEFFPTGNITVLGDFVVGLGDGDLVPAGSIGALSLQALGNIQADPSGAFARLTVDNLAMYAGGDIAFGAPYQLDAGTLAAFAGGYIDTADAGDLTIGSVDGLDGITAEGAFIDILAEESLFVGNGIIANDPEGGDVFLTANYQVFTDEVGGDTGTVIEMTPGGFVTATGDVALTLLGDEFIGTGDITLREISGQTVLVEALGAGGDLFITALITAAGDGDSLVLASKFGNATNVGGGATLDPGAGRYLVYSQSPSTSDLTGLDAAPLYGTDYDPEVSPAFAGDRLVYDFQPTLTITAVSATRLYGDANPEFEFTVDGLIGTDTLEGALQGEPTFTTDAVEASPVGIFAIDVNIEDLTSDYNYLIAGPGEGDLPGELTITPAPLTVTADSGTREYAEDNPLLGFTVAGLKLDDTVDLLSGIVVTSDAVVSSDVGDYATVASGGPGNDNYEIVTLVNGILSVTPAPLTVIADDATRPSGAPDPTFTARFDGLKLDDDAGVVSGLLFATDANAASPPGAFAIRTSGGTATNYVISLRVDGTLTVTEAISPPAPPPGIVEVDPTFTPPPPDIGNPNDFTIGTPLQPTALTLPSFADPSRNGLLYDTELSTGGNEELW